MHVLTATPVQIDTRLADLYGQKYEIVHNLDTATQRIHIAIGDRHDRDSRHQVWRMTDGAAIIAAAAKVQAGDDARQEIAKLLATVAAAHYTLIPIHAEISRLEGEYRRRPWTRFFQLRSTTGAHVHDRQDCPGLYRSNRSDLGWRPELAGSDTETAVEKLGPTLCSKCFPTAPVEWRRDPAELVEDPNRCPGSEQYPVDGTTKVDRSVTRGGLYGEYALCTGCRENRTLRADRKIAKHKKPVVKANEITNPDGSPLKGDHGVLKTVRSAQIEYVDTAAYVLACDRGFPHTGRYAKAKEIAERILTAMAHTTDVTVEAKREELAKKVTARARRDYDR